MSQVGHTQITFPIPPLVSPSEFDEISVVFTLTRHNMIMYGSDGNFMPSMGQNLGYKGGTGVGTLISKFDEKSWDIDIKNLTVSHSHEITCSSCD